MTEWHRFNSFTPLNLVVKNVFQIMENRNRPYFESGLVHAYKMFILLRMSSFNSALCRITATNNYMPEEIFDVVNERDEVVGRAARSEVRLDLFCGCHSLIP